jgi:hypothetical protein
VSFVFASESWRSTGGPCHFHPFGKTLPFVHTPRNPIALATDPDARRRMKSRSPTVALVGAERQFVYMLV